MVIADGEKRHAFDVALDLMKNNEIKADILVTHKFRIKDYRDMIEANLNKEKNRAVKTVVSFDF